MPTTLGANTSDSKSYPTIIVGVAAPAKRLASLQEFLLALGQKPGVAIVYLPSTDAETGSMDDLVDALRRSTSLPISQLRDQTALATNSVYLVPPGVTVELKGGVAQLVESVESRSCVSSVDHFLQSLANDQGRWSVGIEFSGVDCEATSGLKAIRDAGGLTLAESHQPVQSESISHNAITTGHIDHLLGPKEIAIELLRYVATLRIAQLKDMGTDSTVAVSLTESRGTVVANARASADSSGSRSDLLHVMQRMVLDEFSPKSVIVSEDGQIRCASADMQKYLTVSGGTFQNSIIKLARKGLRLGIRAALSEAILRRCQITHENLTVRNGNEVQRVMLTVRPMPAVDNECDLFMIVFHDVGLPIARDQSESKVASDSPRHRVVDTMIEQLELELTTAREDLERSMQDMETANEELKSSNEVLLSMNAELQSANDELEKSKEEIQSGIDALSRSNNHLENLLRSTPVASIFLDSQGLIQWFTPAAAEIYNLIENDIGRPLNHITHNAIHMPDLQLPSPADRFPEHDIETLTGKWYLRRLLPYLRTNLPDGLIVTFIDVTEKKRAAERLSVEHARKSAILESALDSIVTMDIEGRIVDFNPAAEKTFGFHQSQVAGQSLADAIIPAEYRERHLSGLKRFLDSGESQIIGRRIELVAQRASGEQFPVELAISATHSLDGTPFFTAYIRDITAHKANLQAIFDRDERIIALLNSTAEGIYGIDLQGRCTFANTSCARLLGYQSPDELVGQQMHDLIHYAHGDETPYPQADCRIYESYRKGTGIHVDDEVFFRKDGSSLDVEYWSYPLLRAGHTVGCVVTFLDVTERRQSEKALRDREGQFASLVEATSQIVWTTDAQGVVTEDSPSWRAFTGQSLEEWLGNGWLNAIHPDDHNLVLGLWRQSLDTEEQLSLAYRLKHVSGHWRWTQVNAVAQRDDRGHVKRWIGMNTDITDRKRREIEITDREAHLRRVINNQLGLVGVINSDGNLVEVDERSLRIAGLERDDVIGKHFADCAWWTYDADVSATMRKSMNRAFAGEVVRYDVPLYAAGDQRLMIDFMLAPVRDEMGNVTHLIPSGVDISKRKRVEEDLAESRQRLALTMEAARMGSYEWEIESDQVTWDQQHLELTGMPNSQMTGEDFMAHIHPDDVEANRAAIARTIAGEAEYDIDYRFIRPDGQILWLAARGSIIRGKDGESRKFVGLNWDITEQRFAEQRVRLGEARLQRIIDGSSIGIAFARTSGHVMRANNAALAMLGIDRAQFEARGFIWTSSIRIEDIATAADIVAHLKESGSMPPHEMLLQRSDGTQLPVMISCISVDQNDDEHVVFLVDLTQQKQFEKSLQSARALAEAANAAKSAFIANMSHEIRTPMTAVLGYSDLLAAREHDPEKNDFLRTIKRNGIFLLELINDILDLSKIEAGKMELARELFSLLQVINDVRSMMNVRASEKKLLFDVEFEGRIPEEIESDPKRLKQILVNLIGNAIKFTESGSVRLLVRLVVGKTPQVQFDVVDTGIGITEAQIERLFQPFSQGDSSISRAFGGTGLGLAISQRLAEVLGGGISLKSRFGEGSTFTCTIAAGDVSQLKLIQPKLEAEAEDIDADFGKVLLACRVLVVDDRRDVRFLTRHLLTKAGATVELAEDGQHALDLVTHMLNGNQPLVDLILLDMQMPRLDGYETAIQLRRMGYTKPIVALTADAMHGDMNRCLESGCDAYLSKPIDSRALREMVHRFTRQN